MPNWLNVSTHDPCTICEIRFYPHVMTQLKTLASSSITFGLSTAYYITTPQCEPMPTNGLCHIWAVWQWYVCSTVSIASSLYSGDTAGAIRVDALLEVLWHTQVHFTSDPLLTFNTSPGCGIIAVSSVVNLGVLLYEFDVCGAHHVSFY